MKRFLAFILAISACTVATYAQPKLNGENIDEVLAAMTLQEKAALVVGANWTVMDESGAFKTVDAIVNGAAGGTVAIPRLGIPSTVLADGPAGLRIDPTRPGTDATYYCTGFPVGEVLACSWNTEAVKAVTKAMGNEVLEYGVDVLLAPAQNLHRNPLCGRNFEYFSEDPVLSGKISSAYVQGIQSNGVGTSVKHFAANSQETNRLEDNAIISERALRELYLKNFEITVREGKPWTVMSSYNRINGPYTQESHDLLTKILRNEWGFDGIVMTDWTAKRNTPAQIMAGNDLMEPGAPNQIEHLIQAVNSGELDVKDLDVCVRRILEYIVRTPRFAGYSFSNTPDLAAHAGVSREAAGEGMVLLKNSKGLLPLDGGKVALFGIGAYETVAGGTGSGHVNKAYTVSIKDGLAEQGFEPLEDIASMYESYASFAHKKILAERDLNWWENLGTVLVDELSLPASCFEKAAKKADYAIVTIRRNAGEGADRRIADDFNLSADETRMLNDVATAFHSAGKKVIVLMNVGGVIETASWAGLADAILLCWTPGQEAGRAVADILSGKVNPSGKLSMTFPVAYMDHPSSANFPYNSTFNAIEAFMGVKGNGRRNIDYTDYSEGIWVGYRWFDKNPDCVMYPFGYGLSYTTFAYSKPVVKAAADGSFKASVTVTNTGKVAGKEVVELYVSAPEGGMDKPVKELKAFAKTRLLAPGESQTLEFSVSAYELASFNETVSRWETAAGTYNVHFAASSADIRATKSFKVAKPSYFAVSEHALAPAE